MSGIFFIVGLIVVSGLVAYVGDNLGRKIGKKRMRLFGLRPKHTSIVIAVLTGMIITAITIITLMLVFSEIRQMFFQLKQIQEDLITAKAEYERSSQELEQAKAAIASKDRDVILKQELIEEKEAELNDLNTEKFHLIEQVSGLNDAVTALKEEVAGKEEQIAEKDEEIAERTAEVNVLERNMTGLQTQLDDVQSRIDALNSSISGLNDEVKSLGREKLKLENEVAGKIAEITKLREGGVKVFKGQLLAEFRVATSISDADLMRHIRSAISNWSEDPSNVHGNPMEEPAVAKYTEAIGRIRQIQDRFKDDLAVIRIFSDAHVFEDEEIPVMLKVERNLIIYIEGELIIERWFSVDATVDVIRKGLYEMFESLEDMGKEDGMIFEGIDDPVYADFTVLVETARKASYYANDIMLQIVATRDIYSVDYLVMGPDFPEADNLKLVIEEIEG